MGKKCNFLYSCQKWTWTLSQVPRTRFQCYWTQFVPSRPWSQNATNHIMRRQGLLICRNLWLPHFVTVQNATSQIDIKNDRGDIPKYLKYVHIDIGAFAEGFLGISFLDFITEIHTLQVYASNITPKWGEAQLLIFISEVNRDQLTST